MSQDFGMTIKEFQDSTFVGDHPAVMLPGVLISGQTLVAGTVVGKITASGKYTQLAPAASDGSQNAAAIIFGDLDASAGDEPGNFMAHGEVIDPRLTWPAGITTVQKDAAIAALRTIGIYVK